MVCYERFQRKQIVPVALVIIFVCVCTFYDNNTSNISGIQTRKSFPQKTEAQFLQESLDAVEYIRKDCGELCLTNAKGVPGPYFDQITVPIDCDAFFKNEHIDLDLGKTVSITVWTEQLVEDYISLAKENKLEGTYGMSETNALRDGIKHAPDGIINGRVLVIGSQNPWVEACALEAGARKVVTLEYGKL
ncbi:Hypothetical predicted protein [Mytilus galloprovincialis]|uniref:Uncharacterized protein n=1 Tax=Mytilus galloprovincialis TaxID=29158 RepID=A0A8B6ETA3_MYTGA|nr:Hypothetical predicted protein [Mytilus galloprovincialis]